MAETKSAFENTTPDNYVKRKILLFPLVRDGGGTGHLKRCVNLVRSSECFFLLIPACKREIPKVRKVVEDLDAKKIVSDRRARWDWIVFDRKDTSAEELTAFKGYGPLLGLDEGGSARDRFDYCIDTLPNLFPDGSANIFSMAFLNLQQTKRPRETHDGIEKVLITFGGEDAAGLTGTLCRDLLGLGLFAPEQITVVKGPFFTKPSYPEGVDVVTDVTDLTQLFPSYDLVFTSYGHTCFEAVAAGVPVILFNPTDYHRDLSKKIEFPEIGVRRVKKRKMVGLIHTVSSWWPRERETIPEERRSLSEFIRSLAVPDNTACPACGSSEAKAVVRLSDTGYFRCRECKIIYQKRVEPVSVEYTIDYFFSDYKKQYGRTYLEDFSHIKEMSLSRFHTIITLLRNGKKFREPRNGHETVRSGEESPGLLDIGCAYGPFLQAGVEAGFTVFGIDVADEAVKYVTEHLNIPATVTDIERFDPDLVFPKRKRFDVITMWYVIEHVAGPAQVIRKVYDLLGPEGLFCFSTPNSNGISGKNSIERFLRNSPEDHITVWHPESAVKVLEMYGFRVKKVRITGHHPERFPLIQKLPEKSRLKKRLKSGRGVLYDMLLLVSRLFNLGDTFEVYAEKKQADHG